MRASPLDPNKSNKSLTLLSIRRPDDLKHFVTGSDADIGGFSKAALDVYPEESQDAGKGRFHGELSSKVAPGMKLAGSRVDRSGYAGLRSRVGTFGHNLSSKIFDVSIFSLDQVSDPKCLLCSHAQLYSERERGIPLLSLSLKYA